MSSIFCCPKCHQGWHLIGDHEEVRAIIAIIHSEKGPFGCISPLCAGQLIEAPGLPDGYNVRELPVRAFYRALHGFGTGEGDPASHKDFVEQIKNGKIVAVDATPVGQPERVILHQLVFEDGTRMHFDSSSRGACCFYIERPGKSCVEVIEDELSIDEALVPSPDSHREEVGRGDTSTADGQGPKSVASVSPDARPQSTRPVSVRPVHKDSDIPENQCTELQRDG